MKVTPKSKCSEQCDLDVYEGYNVYHHNDGAVVVIHGNKDSHQSPQVSYSTPQASNTTLQVSRSTPQASHTYPQSSYTTPQASHAFPLVPNTSPPLNLPNKHAGHPRHPNGDMTVKKEPNSQLNTRKGNRYSCSGTFTELCSKFRNVYRSVQDGNKNTYNHTAPLPLNVREQSEFCECLRSPSGGSSTRLGQRYKVASAHHYIIPQDLTKTQPVRTKSCPEQLDRPERKPQGSVIKGGVKKGQGRYCFLGLEDCGKVGSKHFAAVHSCDPRSKRVRDFRALKRGRSIQQDHSSRRSHHSHSSIIPLPPTPLEPVSRPSSAPGWKSCNTVTFYDKPDYSRCQPSCTCNTCLHCTFSSGGGSKRNCVSCRALAATDSLKSIVAPRRTVHNSADHQSMGAVKSSMKTKTCSTGELKSTPVKSDYSVFIGSDRSNSSPGVTHDKIQKYQNAYVNVKEKIHPSEYINREKESQIKDLHPAREKLRGLNENDFMSLKIDHSNDKTEKSRLLSSKQKTKKKAKNGKTTKIDKEKRHLKTSVSPKVPLNDAILIRKAKTKKEKEKSSTSESVATFHSSSSGIVIGDDSFSSSGELKCSLETSTRPVESANHQLLTGLGKEVLAIKKKNPNIHIQSKDTPSSTKEISGRMVQKPKSHSERSHSISGRSKNKSEYPNRSPVTSKDKPNRLKRNSKLTKDRLNRPKENLKRLNEKPGYSKENSGIPTNKSKDSKRNAGGTKNKAEFSNENLEHGREKHKRPLEKLLKQSKYTSSRRERSNPKILSSSSSTERTSESNSESNSSKCSTSINNVASASPKNGSIKKKNREHNVKIKIPVSKTSSKKPPPDPRKNKGRIKKAPTDVIRKERKDSPNDTYYEISEIFDSPISDSVSSLFNEHGNKCSEIKGRLSKEGEVLTKRTIRTSEISDAIEAASPLQNTQNDCPKLSLVPPPRLKKRGKPSSQDTPANSSFKQISKPDLNIKDAKNITSDEQHNGRKHTFERQNSDRKKGRQSKQRDAGRRLLTREEVTSPKPFNITTNINVVTNGEGRTCRSCEPAEQVARDDDYCACDKNVREHKEISQDKRQKHREGRDYPLHSVSKEETKRPRDKEMDTSRPIDKHLAPKKGLRREMSSPAKDPSIPDISHNKLSLDQNVSADPSNKVENKLPSPSSKNNEEENDLSPQISQVPRNTTFFSICSSVSDEVMRSAITTPDLTNNDVMSDVMMSCCDDVIEEINFVSTPLPSDNINIDIQKSVEESELENFGEVVLATEEIQSKSIEQKGDKFIKNEIAEDITQSNAVNERPDPTDSRLDLKLVGPSMNEAASVENRG